MIAWIREKLIDVIMYVAYVRMFLEAHESMMLSCSAEIYEWDTSSTDAIISQIVAWIVLLICLIMPAVGLYLFYTTRRKFDPDEKFVLMEFFADLKNTKWARVYTACLLARRVIFVAIVIFMPGKVNRTIIYAILFFSQLLYLAVIVSSRTFTLLDSRETL
jgi:hypothetical protein